MLLIHGFNHTDATAPAAVRAVIENLGTNHVWLARHHHRNRLARAGYRGGFIDEDRIAAGHLAKGAMPDAVAWPDSDRETLNLLADREGTPSSHFEMNLRVEGARIAVLQAIEEHSIEGAVFDDVPHALATYLFSKALKALGRPVLVVRAGPAPHQRVLVLDHDAPLISQISVEGADRPSQRSTALVQRLRSDYKTAEPTYMRQQRQMGGLVRRSARKLAQARVSALKPSVVEDLRTLRRRASLKRAYENMCERPPSTAPFVTVFLHLQPERTTVPEGGKFAQQLLVVEHLRRALSDDWRIVVREHPSTFMTGPKLVRTKSFYETLIAIPGVQLVSLAEDPFKLIGASRLIATVTGTVGLEAVARGVPAVFYGNPAYVGCPGATDGRLFRLGDSTLVTTALESSPSADGVLRFLAQFDSSSDVWTPAADDPRAIEQIFASGDLYRELIRLASEKLGTVLER